MEGTAIACEFCAVAAQGAPPYKSELRFTDLLEGLKPLHFACILGTVENGE
jgi:hypothetical protein